MRVLIKAALGLAVLIALSGCATKFRSYDGPEVTRVIVYKESRRLYLLHENRVLKSYRIDLGLRRRATRRSRVTAERLRVTT